MQDSTIFFIFSFVGFKDELVWRLKSYFKPYKV
jgi:hypothetical protein